MPKTTTQLSQPKQTTRWHIFIPLLLIILGMLGDALLTGWLSQHQGPDVIAPIYAPIITFSIALPLSLIVFITLITWKIVRPSNISKSGREFTLKGGVILSIVVLCSIFFTYSIISWGAGVVWSTITNPQGPPRLINHAQNTVTLAISSCVDQYMPDFYETCGSIDKLKPFMREEVKVTDVDDIIILPDREERTIWAYIPSEEECGKGLLSYVQYDNSVHESGNVCLSKPPALADLPIQVVE